MLADGMPKSENLLTSFRFSPVADCPVYYSLLQLQTTSDIPKRIFA